MSIIPQTNELLQAGSIVPPPSGGRFTIKKFLKIQWKPCDRKDKISLTRTIKEIRKVVFGGANYKKYKKLLNTENFEYLPKINYLELLNKHYFYNLPDFSPSVPARNVILFPEDNENAIPNNPFGATEYCDGANRLMSDMWTSSELDLETALREYKLSPDNYKPSVLPTCLLRITKQSDEYSNIAMIGNDTLTVEFFNEPIAYPSDGETEQKPVARAKVIFPETLPKTRLMNIQQWTDLVNKTFQNKSNFTSWQSR